MHARKGPVFRGWLAKWACCLASTVGMALPRTQNKRHAPPPLGLGSTGWNSKRHLQHAHAPASTSTSAPTAPSGLRGVVSMSRSSCRMCVSTGSNTLARMSSGMISKRPRFTPGTSRGSRYSRTVQH